jgi:outer membrane lipoprotein-sorting protein
MKIRQFILAFLFLPLSSSLAQQMSAQEMIKRADDLLRGDTSDGYYAMTVTTPTWTRTLKLHAISFARSKTYIKILEPIKEAGITTLRIDTNMWNYLPKVERTIKIPPSMMLEPWMGSDFSNDDLVKESSLVNDYTHKIIAEETLDGFDAYKIELTPKPNAAVAWGKLHYWVRKADLVPLKEDFYDEHGTLIKTLHYTKVKQMSDRSIPTIWTMISHTKPGNKTVIEITAITYNKPVNDNVFSLQNLKK